MTSIFTEMFDPRRQSPCFWVYCLSCDWAAWRVVCPLDCPKCDGEVRVSRDS